VDTRTVLVVGAGIAGSTLAYWLSRHGFDTTVVERAEGERSSGSPVDVRGPAVRVAERMGLLPSLREAATLATGIVLVDNRGRRIGRVPTQTNAEAVEIPRSDLAAILADASRDDVEFIYGDSVVTIAESGQGVDVTFERAAPRRFDLVVGADGLHSRVRWLTFGPESQFVEHLGMYVATVPLDGSAEDQKNVVMHSTPGRAVAVHPATGRGIVAFIFRYALRPALYHRDSDRQKQLMSAAYAGVGWQVPELLERVRGADDLYFDSVSRVRLDTWSRGRIGLVGDAASCATLLGDGSSMAIAGAATLAEALAAQPAEPTTALHRYEQSQRKLIGSRQRRISVASHLLVPATRAGLAARNTGFRIWPAIAAAGRVVGRPVAA